MAKVQILLNMAMENPEKISLQFELLNTYYSKIACKMTHTPVFIITTYLYSYKLFQSVEYSDGAIDWIKRLLHCLEVGIEDTSQTPVELC